jgi:hypothetical protein
MKRNTVLYLVSILLVFALVLTACPTPLDDGGSGNGNGTGNGDDTTKVEPAAANKASLESAITAAEAEKALVAISVDGSDVASGKDWVTQAVMDTFDAVIAAAKAVKDNTAATQAEVDAALSVLNAARATFGGAKAPGTKTSNFTMAELAELITAADSVKTGVVSSANGSDVYPTVQWVPAAILDALDAAISAAEAITEGDPQPNKDAAYTALNNAKNDFNTAKKPGTKVVALSGKTYFEYDNKIVFSVTSTLSGTYTASEALYNGDGNSRSPILTGGGKYTYEESETGTYTVNEGNSTVTLTPTKVQLYSNNSNNSNTWTVVNKAQYRAAVQTMLDDYTGQPDIDQVLTEMGFSSVSEFIDYMIDQEFAGKSMGYSFSSDGAALFLDGSLPANNPVLPDELSGKTLNCINYFGQTDQTVEFSGGYTYKIKSGGSTIIEFGSYSLSSTYTGSVNGEDGFKRVNIKPQTVNGLTRAGYYDSLSSYSDSGYYEDINAHNAGETNGKFGVYESVYKLSGGTVGIYLRYY